MDDCEGCIVYIPAMKQACIVMRTNQVDLCPCRLCLVKLFCKTNADTCLQYQALIKECYIQLNKHFNYQDGKLI